jgi:hypothetical protein
MRWRARALWASGAAGALVLLVRCGAFSGTNDGSSGDASAPAQEGGSLSDAAGASVIDANATGSADGGRFCDQYPAKTGTYCFDFDDPQFPPTGLAAATMGDGKVDRVDASVSPPFALRSAMTKGAALLQSASSLHTPATKLRIRTGVNAPGDISDTNVNLAQVGQFLFLLVFDSSAGVPGTVSAWITNSSTNKGDYVCLKVNYAPNTWFDVDLTYDFGSSTMTGTINGATCASPAADAPRPPDAGPFTLAANIGVAYTRDGGMSVLLDNYAAWLQ